jgi:hypothetical protein
VVQCNSTNSKHTIVVDKDDPLALSQDTSVYGRSLIKELWYMVQVSNSAERTFFPRMQLL